MGQFDKLLTKVLSGSQDNEINFEDLCKVLNTFKFKKRIKGSNHIFTKEGIEEIINLQPAGLKAKPYQVKQVRKIILKYGIGGDIDV